MVKHVIILFNLISFIGVGLGLLDPVEIEVNAPSTAEAGSTIKVELTINKSAIDGFAKLQQNFPDKLSATKEETSNATFSFKDQVLKCLWMSIPQEESFIVSYFVKIDDNAAGSFDIDGTFSYIDNNEKKVVDVRTITIKVGTEEVASKEEEPVKPETTPTPQENKPKITPSKRDPENGVLCMRTTSPIKGKPQEFKVEIKVNSNKSGFAKIEEYIPQGFTATEIESMEGLFSFKNNVVKIIWMSLPTDPEFNIAYKLVADENVTGNQQITGVFAYIEGNSTKKFELTPSTIFIEKDDNDVATIIIDDEGGTFTEKEEFPVPKPEDDDKVKTFASEEPVEKEAVKKDSMAKEPVTKVPEPDSEVIYKVQVAAGHKSVASNYFEKKYDLKQKVGIENHQGWIKYTVGGFKVYKQGRDHRNTIWNENKITDAFVTAYNYGNRITVQEALMITNQKWIN